mmetsp:Transcript_2525/g.7019  ORF Transcript_2525/g.7019 Transcript_2525/m.7019 type:complete len:238 (+) Transcript_2525:587-1300(+)
MNFDPGWLKSSHGQRRTEHGGGASAIKFHLFHHGHLDIVSTRVKEQSFANASHRLFDVSTGRSVGEVNELGFRFGSARHAEVGAHTPRLALGGAPNLAFKTATLRGNGPRRIGQRLRIQHIVRRIDDILGEVASARHDLADSNGLRRHGRVVRRVVAAGRYDHQLHARQVFGRRLDVAAKPIVPVQGGIKGRRQVLKKRRLHHGRGKQDLTRGHFSPRLVTGRGNGGTHFMGHNVGR